MESIPLRQASGEIDKLWETWLTGKQLADSSALRSAFEFGLTQGTRVKRGFKRVSLSFERPEGIREHIKKHVLITPSGCWEWMRGRTGSNYGIMEVDGRQRPTHRISANVFLGFDLTSPLDICHVCDNPPCCNPGHLVPGTRAYNIQDSVRKGRFGAEKPKKLTAEAVASIRRLSKMGIGTPTIAAMYGVSQSCAWTIVRLRWWKKQPDAAPSLIAWNRRRGPTRRMKIEHCRSQRYIKGCRCRGCKDAANIRRKLRRIGVTLETLGKPIKRKPKVPRPWQHGPYAYKNGRCSCKLCRRSFDIRSKLRKIRVTKQTLDTI